MATTPYRRSYYPPISKQPTSEELARHLRLIYQALNDHDTAIVTLHQQVNLKAQTPATSRVVGGQPLVITAKPTTRNFGVKKIKVP